MITVVDDYSRRTCSFDQFRDFQKELYALMRLRASKRNDRTSLVRRQSGNVLNINEWEHLLNWVDILAYHPSPIRLTRLKWDSQRSSEQKGLTGSTNRNWFEGGDDGLLIVEYRLMSKVNTLLGHWAIQTVIFFRLSRARWTLLFCRWTTNGCSMWIENQSSWDVSVFIEWRSKIGEDIPSDGCFSRHVWGSLFTGGKVLYTRTDR